jgi:hypothetical protein
MSRLVEPVPFMHRLCDGELILKSIEAASPESDRDVEIYLCAKCGFKQSRFVPNETHPSPSATGNR